MSLVADYSDSDEEEAPNNTEDDVGGDRHLGFKGEVKHLSNSESGAEKDRKQLSVKGKGNNSNNNFLLSGVNSGSSESESDEEPSKKK